MRELKVYFIIGKYRTNNNRWMRFIDSYTNKKHRDEEFNNIMNNFDRTDEFKYIEKRFTTERKLNKLLEIG